MIVCVDRINLDEIKYNNCIAKATTSKIYAFSWYLDSVADNWEVLVFNDYQAVMPLPWKKKMGISYITQPFFCQQLGIFSTESIATDIENLFIKKIPKRFLRVHLQLHTGTGALVKKRQEKDNFILPLNKPLNQLYKNFYKGRKHALNRAEKNQLIIDAIPFDQLLKLCQANYNYSEFKESDYAKLQKLIGVLQAQKRIQILGAFKQGELLGGAVFMSHADRIIYLFSAAKPLGKKLQAPTLLIDSIIKQYANTHKILDFEGSILPTIASFFKSFGAEKETYFSFKKPWL